MIDNLKLSTKLFLLRVTVAILNAVEAILWRTFRIQLTLVSYKRLKIILSEGARKELEKPEVGVPFKLMCDGLARDPYLTLRGSLLQLVENKNALESRARMVKACEMDPTVKEVPIKKPIFLLSAHRTGSTFLNRVLLSDPSLQGITPLLASDPASLTKEGINVDINGSVRKFKALADMSGLSKLQSVHKFGATTAEEASFLLVRNGFKKPLICWPDSMAEYYHYYSHAPREMMVKTYEFLKLQLQFIGRYQGMENKRFVIKYHPHADHIDALLDVFPDAVFVVSRRHPIPVILSALQGFKLWLSATTVNREDSQKEAFKKAASFVVSHLKFGITSLESKLKVFNQPGLPPRLFEVDFKDLTAQPMDIIRQLYRDLGMPLSSEVEEEMMKFINDKSSHKSQGSRKSTVEDYGLDSQDIERQFADYIDTYKL